MQITYYGAAGEVTGSCYLVATDRARVLVDCGMFQGADADRRNRLPRELHPDQIDAVALTHAHLDHCGRLPLLVQGGYRGPIHATPATIDLLGLLLADAAQLQAGDIERANRKRQRAGLEPAAPLFDQADVAAVLGLTRPLPYEQPTTLAPGLQIRMVEAGHILGSASIVMQIDEREHDRIVVFSGDLGPRGAPILNDPAEISKADMVVLESTYGDRDHRPLADTLTELAELLLHAALHHSKVLIPAFAVGRTQEILYHLAALFREGLVPPMPVYLDSPLAIKATELYLRYPDLADADSRRLSRPGRLWRGLATLRSCVTAEESRALNHIDGPCIIIAGSGMCTGGRILHHLRHQLWRPETLVVFAGYQAEGTLGRQIIEGARRVQIFGETIAVRAAIYTLGGLSAHAGQSELVQWLAPVASERPRVILTHGEAHSRAALARCIADRYGIGAELPSLGDVI
jgi:metallo-beta-lactamase family protein